MVRYTILSNLHSLPTDCPQREKRGWLGDSQWVSGAASLRYDMMKLYANWLRTFEDTQMVECAQLQIVAGAIIPWELLTRTGRTPSPSMYSVARSVVDFLTRHVAPETGLVEFGYYGDWCAAEKTNRSQVTGWSHLLSVSRMVDMARALAMEHPDEKRYAEDAIQYNALFDRLKVAYHDAYFNASEGNYGHSQTANALPLFLNITPPALVPGVARTLAKSLQSHDDSILSGAMGARYVFEALAENGFQELALDISTSVEQPSFGYMALQGPAGGNPGAGTVWEKWLGNCHDYGGGSKNHPMFTGGIGVYLHRIAGISRREHGRIHLKPGGGDFGVAARIGGAVVSIATDAGELRMQWRAHATGEISFHVNMSVPLGLQERVVLHVPCHGQKITQHVHGQTKRKQQIQGWKALKRQRQLEKPHGDNVFRAKALWNKLRERGKAAGGEEEISRVSQILALLRGRLQDVVCRHDASRVVQACFQYGTAEQREEIFKELRSIMLELCMTQYGKFLVTSMIRYSDSALCEKIVACFKGNAVRLGTHTMGCAVLEVLFNGRPSRVRKSRNYVAKETMTELFSEFYGKSFQIFSKKGEKLSQFLERSTESQRRVVMDDLERNLGKMIAKGLHRLSFSHPLILEFLSHCDATSTEASNMRTSLLDAALELSSTVDGSEIMSDCVAHGSAKDRKTVVKQIKGRALGVAMHPCGHIVLMRILQVVDDTTLVRKSVFKEIVEEDGAMGQLLANDCGARLALFLLNPGEAAMKRFQAERVRKILMKEHVSKKDPETRRQEHLGTIKDSIISACSSTDACVSMLMSRFSGALLKEVLKQYAPAAVMDALRAAVATDANSRGEGSDGNKEKEEEE
eukprot:g1865.t1